ncbi:glycosyltransferase [Synechococcus sp. UW140]|uniref:glycosyltransferase n=1 Tax=Synechococcus sp. UW140 TaxID=368503 RepID=UPI0031384648
MERFVSPICSIHNSGYLIYAQNISIPSSPSLHIRKLPYFVKLKLSSLADLPFVLPTIIYILWLLIALRPNVVISHMTLNSPIVLFCSYIMRTPKRIYFNHGFSFLGYESIIRVFLLIEEFLNFAFSTQVICVSPTQAKIVSQLKLLPKVNILPTIPGSCAGLSSNLYISLSRLQEKQDDVLERNNPLNVVYIGRPVKRKGFSLVLETIKIIEMFYSTCLSPNIFFEFTFIGISEDDFERSNSKCLLNLQSSSISCISYAGNIFDYLEPSSVMFLPSFHEGFGYAYLEAASQGNCLVGFDIPGPDSILLNSVNGYALPLASSPSDFANALIKLNSNRHILSLFMKNSYLKSLQFERSSVLSSISGIL